MMVQKARVFGDEVRFLLSFLSTDQMKELGIVRGSMVWSSMGMSLEIRIFFSFLLMLFVCK